MVKQHNFRMRSSRPFQPSYFRHGLLWSWDETENGQNRAHLPNPKGTYRRYQKPERKPKRSRSTSLFSTPSNRCLTETCPIHQKNNDTFWRLRCSTWLRLLRCYGDATSGFHNKKRSTSTRRMVMSMEKREENVCFLRSFGSVLRETPKIGRNIDVAFTRQGP